MRRSKPLRRQSLQRSGGVKKVNRKRRISEFARCYGSKARVAWIQATPCILCGKLPSENVHVTTGGMGRKSGHEKIVPMCATMHRMLHNCGRKLFEAAFQIDLEAAAASTHARWLARADATET